MTRTLVESTAVSTLAGALSWEAVRSCHNYWPASTGKLFQASEISVQSYTDYTWSLGEKPLLFRHQNYSEGGTNTPLLGMSARGKDRYDASSERRATLISAGPAVSQKESIKYTHPNVRRDTVLQNKRPSSPIPHLQQQPQADVCGKERTRKAHFSSFTSGALLRQLLLCL